ncbi:MAG: amino-acid N-acetyltransferase [Gammaproteobacteria bacterium]|nr:amino-acid N-acetyltransferase [Gammaproteobacteria bacterium]
MHTQDYVKWFRASSPYINAHRDKTFVVAFGGEAVQHANFMHVIQDIVLLHSLGIRMVLVHGARPQIDARLQESGISTRVEQHRRVTDLAALPAVIEAIGRTRIQVEAGLSQGIAAAHLQGSKTQVASGNFITARPYGVRNGVDYQHSGEVRKVNAEAIRTQLHNGALVLLSPLGFSPTGEVFNLLWEEVAEAAAVALQADKLIYLNADTGVLGDSGELIRELTVPQATDLLGKLDEPRSNPHFTLISATRALKQVGRAHLISYQTDGALLQELFTVDGSGTLITQQSFENIRNATIEDVGGVLELIEPLEQEGILVRRSRELLETEIPQFTLIERDEKIIACAALNPFTADRTGELACVAVHPDYRHGKRGDQLLQAIEQRARGMGLNRLFVLTTRTAHWFMERGFTAATVTELPQHRQSLYNYQRNSKVFIKILDPA